MSSASSQARSPHTFKARRGDVPLRFASGLDLYAMQSEFRAGLIVIISDELSTFLAAHLSPPGCITLRNRWPARSARGAKMPPMLARHIRPFPSPPGTSSRRILLCFSVSVSFHDPSVHRKDARRVSRESRDGDLVEEGGCYSTSLDPAPELHHQKWRATRTSASAAVTRSPRHRRCEDPRSSHHTPSLSSLSLCISLPGCARCQHPAPLFNFNDSLCKCSRIAALQSPANNLK